MKPVIGIVCDTYFNGKHLYHQVGDKYIVALTEVGGALPLLVPSLANPLDPDEILDLVDGMLFTGAPANVQRQLYGLPPAPDDENEDPLRDQTSLPFIEATIDRGIPMLGICRGFQELNVVMGGTLFPRIHEIAGRMDHRENPADPVDVQYGPAHKLTPEPGGVLAGIVGEAPFDVNSIHMQGVDRVADSLAVEGRAVDGTVEALSVKDAPGFTLAMQWHPEWKAASNPYSVKIFNHFTDQARQFRAGRTRKNP
ncbi:MAG: gamma-glutamyl-gamma-aminobutyrate hydrolase family protein [Alphaproteobacteria bacterium]|nr:MAG: gamma-glutamyl-gamma-aminobutyrate hydrolase family protein [Alphaproteobacteria bacterium]